MGKAIIIPVNPDLAYAGGSFVGRVLPHITHIRRTGGVLWNCGRSLPSDHDRIKTGYFYEKNRHAITYQFEIIRFIDWSNRDELESFIEESARPDASLSEAQYVPDFRFKDLFAIACEFEAGERQAAIGILIKAIYPLQKTVDPRNLVKVSDKKTIQTLAAVRAHPIVYTSPLVKPKKREIEPKEFIHTHIMKIIDKGGFNEKDIEDMLEYILYDSNCELVERQPILKDGRIDIVYKKGPTYFVIELKRRSAGISALRQIQNYMDRVKKEYNPKKLEGIVVCETASKRLKEAVSESNSVSVREFKLLIDFGLELS